MDKNLLTHCRYYRGEASCPFVDSDKRLLWDWERSWVVFHEEADKDENSEGAEFLNQLVSEYLFAGLGDFSKFDGVPLSLKALLFNRFNQWNEAPGFQRWYLKYYK